VIGSRERDVSGTLQTFQQTPANSAGGVSNVGYSDAPFLEFENVPPLSETEDLLQYLLSVPQGWPTSIPAGTAPESWVENYGVIPNLGDNGEDPEFNDETSPRAVLQMNAMITDMVCGAMSKQSI
jgi:hypothetical protein